MNELFPHFPLSRRAETLPESPIRELLRRPKSEGTLDLAGGLPSPACFPVEEFRAATETLLRHDPAAALAYSSTEGLPELREWIQSRLAERGLPVAVDDITITSGSQQALSSLALTLLDARTPVLVENPGYPGAFTALALSEAPLVPLPVTPTGWDLSSLPARVSLAYVAPHHQNPTGRSASPSEQDQLLDAMTRRGALLFEDDAYGELHYGGAPNVPLAARAPARVLLAGSFSKWLAPGLRLGYVVTPKLLTRPLRRVLQASHLQPSTFTQHLALEVLRLLDLGDHLGRLRAHYRQGSQRLLAALGSAPLSTQPPSGGMFLWPRVPGSATWFAEALRTRDVLLLPERVFHLAESGDRHLRLSVTNLKSDDEVGRLSAVLGETLAELPLGPRP